MKLRVLSVLATLALIFGVAALLNTGTNSTKAAFAVCTVPGTHATIQAAVNDAGCSTINVAAGTYTENVTIGRTLTLNGAQTGNDARGRVAAESIINGANPVGGNPVISIQAADVRVDGFTFKNTITTGAGYGIAVKNTGGGSVVTNNIFDGITTADVSGNGTAQAVYLEAGPDNVTISKNDMRNVHGNRSTKGILIGDSNSTNPSQNVVIANNAISNITSDARGAYGVQINNGNGTTSNSGLQVTGNTISNLTGAGTGSWVHAIGLEANTPNVIVSDNVISNLLSTTPDVVGVWFEANPSFGTAQVHNNNLNLTASQGGIVVQPALVTAFPSSSVDGTCNWWNSPTGPTAASNPGGTGAAVSPGVSYKPWLNAPAPGAVCGTVVTNKNQCKDNGWMTLFRADGSTFKNQGDCIQYANTGK